MAQFRHAALGNTQGHVALQQRRFGDLNEKVSMYRMWLDL